MKLCPRREGRGRLAADEYECKQCGGSGNVELREDFARLMLEVGLFIGPDAGRGCSMKTLRATLRALNSAKDPEKRRRARVELAARVLTQELNSWRGPKWGG